MLLCIFRAGYAGKLAMLLHQHAVVISLLSPLAVDNGKEMSLGGEECE